MKKNKKLFPYKNKIILTNGSSLQILSIKYIHNYQLNINLFKKIKKSSNLNEISNKKNISFFDKIKNI